MNGVPVYPVPQNGERPYPEGRKMVFSTPVFGAYPRLILVCSLHLHPTLTTPPTNPGSISIGKE